MQDNGDSLEPLLRHRAFVRAIARAVLADGDLADDVVQQTWIAASDGAAPPTKGLLATIARNLAINLRRSRARRLVREQASPAPKPSLSPQQILESEEERRHLVTAVLELGDPYRSTVLLRYFDELSPRAIAVRTGVPIETVKTRLKRAQEQLRQRLLRADDGATIAARKRALLVLAAARPESTVIATSIGVALMSAKSWMLAGVAAVAISLFAVSVFDATREDAARAESAEPTSAMSSGGAAPADSSAAAEASRVDASGPQPATPIHEGTSVRGRIVDRLRNPIRTATLVLRRRGKAKDELTTSARSDGTFSISLPPRGEAEPVLDLSIDAEGFAHRTLAAREPAQGVVVVGDIVLELGGIVTGHVVDFEGRPVGGADVVATKSGKGDDSRTLATQLPAGRSAKTAADGSFRIAGVAAGWCSVFAKGTDTLLGVVPSIAMAGGSTPTDVLVRLERESAKTRITGRVLDATGVAIPGANLDYTGRFEPDANLSRMSWFSQLTSDDHGEFRIVVPADSLHQFRYSARDGRSADSGDVRPGDPEVVLRVPDALLVPIAVKDKSTGAPLELRSAEIRFGDESRYGWWAKTDAAPAVATPASTWSLVVTAEGYEPATIEGLPAFGPANGLVIELVPRRSIRGRVTVGGQPFAGADVIMKRYTPTQPMESYGFIDTRIGWEPITKSAADGSFVLTPGERWAGPQCVVIVKADGFAVTEAGPYTFSATAHIPELDLELTRGGRLVGFVRVPNGSNPAGVVVAASRGDGDPMAVRADETGAYVLEHLAPGPWRVELRDEDVQKTQWYGADRDPSPPNVHIEDGVTSTLDLELDARNRARIEGSIVFDDTPRSDIRISVLASKSGGELRSENADVSQSTEVAFADVAPDGRYALAVDDTGARVLEVVLLQSGTDLRLRRDVTLSPGLQTFDLAIHTGRIEGRNARPTVVGSRRTYRIELDGILDDGTVLKGKTYEDEDGAYAFPCVPAGTATVRLADGSEHVVTVIAGQTVRVEP